MSAVAMAKSLLLAITHDSAVRRAVAEMILAIIVVAGRSLFNSDEDYEEEHAL